MKLSTKSRFQASFVLMLAVILAGNTTINAQTASKPNIVLIMVDDLNDYLGFLNGHPQTETPHMNELARRSTVFENAFCASPVCAPSRTSLLTGKDPSYTQVFSNSGKYVARKTFRDVFTAADNNETIFTIPEVLKDSGGYYTANFHKIYHGWSNEGYDNDFDTTEVTACEKTKSWNQFLDYGLDEDQLPDTTGYGTFYHGMSGMPMGPLSDAQEDSMNDTRMVTRAIDFMMDYAASPADFCDRPFFAAVGIFRPHLPYLAPERFFSDYYERDYSIFPYPTPYNEPADVWPPNGIVHTGSPQFKGQDYNHLSDFAKQLSAGTVNTDGAFNSFADNYEPLPQLQPGLDSIGRRTLINESQRSLALLNYLASVRFADHQVGRLTNTIHSIPALADNTVIILVSDNGYSFREHQHYHKFGLWETDIRVPLVIYDPRNQVDNQISRRTVGLLDLFPTIMEIAQTEAPTFPDGSKYLDGTSLVPFLTEPDKQFNRPALTTTKAPNMSGGDGTCFSQFSIRSEEWHYIRYQTNGNGPDCEVDSSQIIEELYNIGMYREKDADEWNNLANDTLYNKLKKYLAQWQPDGPLYTQSTGTLEIKGIECSDSMTLSTKYTNGTDPIQRFWYIGDSVVQSSTVILKITEPTVVQLVGRTSDYFLLDIQTVYPGPMDPAFTVSLDDNIAVINVSQDVHSHWEYGDGFVSDGKGVSHAYSRPGNYSIVRSIGYGICKSSDTVSFYISDSAFTENCVAPTGIKLVNLSSGKAHIRWNSSYNATSYEFNYRPKYLSNLNNWLTFTTADTVVMLSKLVPDREYAYRVRALGDSCVGEWSYTQNFVTLKCDPPSLAKIDSLTSESVYFNWTPGQFGAIISQQMGYMPVTGPPPVINTFAISDSTASYSGLAPGTAYWLRGRSTCQQYDGTNRFSLLSYPIQFSTPATREMPEQASAAIQLGVYDLLGRKLIDERELENSLTATPRELLPEWLPAGTYVVNGELVVK